DTAETDYEVPLPKPLTVGITYTLKKETSDKAPDSEAEFDSIDTVNAIAAALEKHGCKTMLLEADASLAEKLKNGAKPDIIFNIAEGRGGRGREAQIPELLDMLGIPYAGSDGTALAVSLDKDMTKRLLSTWNVKTPKSAVVGRAGLKGTEKLKFPVIVKPNAEGSGKGITDVSVAADSAALGTLIDKNIALYGEDMLAEEYISGREFTVGLIGNGDSLRVFEPMEIIYNKKTDGNYCVYSYNVKQNYKAYVEYRCPADIDKKTSDKLKKSARAAFCGLGCSDFARADFRLSDNGEVYFIEINPLPGLAPGYSDYPMLADFNGVTYDELIYGVLCAALKRLGEI
ncbi:MAG: ATP-grasp domain-containing protein, partial [Eubacteriales bacterium]